MLNTKSNNLHYKDQLTIKLHQETLIESQFLEYIAQAQEANRSPQLPDPCSNSTPSSIALIYMTSVPLLKIQIFKVSLYVLAPESPYSEMKNMTQRMQQDEISTLSTCQSPYSEMKNMTQRMQQDEISTLSTCHASDALKQKFCECTDRTRYSRID
ncbi:hypothetical protein QE152_g13585 [Popillia japonica]|uniref:Uncharacterized protein n=1 Tax=Popillia japonica TaxID=7064 RepID=A0AAW1LBA6_POPJA